MAPLLLMPPTIAAQLVGHSISFSLNLICMLPLRLIGLQPNDSGIWSTLFYKGYFFIDVHPFTSLLIRMPIGLEIKMIAPLFLLTLYFLGQILFFNARKSKGLSLALLQMLNITPSPPLPLNLLGPPTFLVNSALTYLGLQVSSMISLVPHTSVLILSFTY